MKIAKERERKRRWNDKKKITRSLKILPIAKVQKQTMLWIICCTNNFHWERKCAEESHDIVPCPTIFALCLVCVTVVFAHNINTMPAIRRHWRKYERYRSCNDNKNAAKSVGVRSGLARLTHAIHIISPLFFRSAGCCLLSLSFNIILTTHSHARTFFRSGFSLCSIDRHKHRQWFRVVIFIRFSFFLFYLNEHSLFPAQSTIVLWGLETT